MPHFSAVVSSNLRINLGEPLEVLLGEIRQVVETSLGSQQVNSSSLKIYLEEVDSLHLVLAGWEPPHHRLLSEVKEQESVEE